MSQAVEIKTTVTENVQYLMCDLGVRYWEDGEVNGVEDTDGSLIPLKEGDRWKIKIDISNGRILNWKEGTTAKVHYKVCDDGRYDLLNDGHDYIWGYAGYVPDCLGSMGDYVVLEIDENGFIKDFVCDVQQLYDSQQR